jgi:lycopene beta-cyclase
MFVANLPETVYSRRGVLKSPQKSGVCWKLPKTANAAPVKYLERDRRFRKPQVAVCLEAGQRLSQQENPPKDTSSLYFDIAIVGAGPAGLALAAELSELNLSSELSPVGKVVSIVVVEKDFSRRWLPNYGVWVDEVEHLDIKDCFAAVWPKVAVYLPHKIIKKREYARIDRQKLKQKLTAKCLRNGSGIVLQEGEVKGSDLEKGILRLRCTSANGQFSELEIRARRIVDTTGHSTVLVKFTEPHHPSYQAAYGIEALVESHPFPLDEMILMDYREPSSIQRLPKGPDSSYYSVPTFLYAMPMASDRIFVEETSLTARPAVPFEELRDRLYKRLKDLGITVNCALEEEFCLIPMGGSLPDLDQPLLGFGGTAGLVHPATGYMMARTLNLARPLARAIFLREARNLETNPWKEVLWTRTNVIQRDFYTFGGEVLLDMNLNEIQEFFAAFFKLRDEAWKNFLSFRQLSGQERLAFGLGVFLKTTNKVRFKLIRKALQNWRPLIRSILS